MGHYVSQIQAYDGGPNAEYVKVWVEDPWDSCGKLDRETRERRIEEDRRAEKLRKRKEQEAEARRDPTEWMNYWEKISYASEQRKKQEKRDFAGDKTDYVRKSINKGLRNNAYCFELVDECHFKYFGEETIVAYANFALLAAEFKQMDYKVTFNLDTDKDGWGKYIFIVHPHDQYWYMCSDKIQFLKSKLQTVKTRKERNELEKELAAVKNYKAKCY